MQQQQQPMQQQPSPHIVSMGIARPIPPPPTPQVSSTVDSTNSAVAVTKTKLQHYRVLFRAYKSSRKNCTTLVVQISKGVKNHKDKLYKIEKSSPPFTDSMNYFISERWRKEKQNLVP